MSISEKIVYVLVGVFAALIILAGVILRKTLKLKFQAVSTNKTLFNIFLVIGVGAMLCIPEKSSVWVVCVFLFVMLVMILKRFRDGVDDRGICLAGRVYDFSKFEAYSMRRMEKVTEFRFYRPGSIRMMAFSNKESEDVERFIASYNLPKKDFQQIRVGR